MNGMRPQEHPTGRGQSRVGVDRIPVRLAMVCAVLALVLEVGSLLVYAAASGFAPALSVPPNRLLASGQTGATLIRVGSLVDLFGYACILPVVLHLRDRYAGAKLIDLYTVAGLMLVAIGAVGAGVMATAAPSLISAYPTAAPAERQSLEIVFGMLYRAVVEGLWQTLETIPAAVWLLGTATAARRAHHRVTFWLLFSIGLIDAGIALFRLTGF